MNLVHIVALLAAAQFFAFGVLVGRARVKYGVKPPATCGHEGFEPALRLQANTVEQPAGLMLTVTRPVVLFVLALAGVILRS